LWIPAGVFQREDRGVYIGSRTASDIGTLGRCPKVRQVVLQGGLTGSQLGDLEHAASINVADWHQKEAESEDKDTASKESELIRGFSRQRVRSGKQSQNETTDIFTTTPPPRSCPTPTSSKRDEQKGLVDLPVNLRIRC
jgi:hypothetical protein